ncbi:carbamoyltransferase HypF [Streptomyces smaragdinus]|nr:carbamoyltransferase HypF [Streptomyces smaragdinus]
MNSPLVHVRLRVEGIVQGVGFRPFVHTIAVRHGLRGQVANDPDGVLIDVTGPADAVAGFRRTLEGEAPPLAVIERISVRRREAAPPGETGFTIAAGPDDAPNGPARALIPPDIATCADCLGELFDPADRRHRHPFINCTNCGPRYTVVRSVPYDRSRTTMAGFPMCAACAREYHDPTDRRFHAQPLCCPDCGPALRLTDARTGTPIDGDPVAGAAALLRAGRIVAVKGLGGYHLAADAFNERAVHALRSRKHREEKPFAVLVPDPATADRLCEVDDTARALLTSPRAPIVLLPRREDAGVAPSVAPGRRELGLLLPYTPVHHLLCAQLPHPYVLTSGNLSDEPIAHHDDEARRRLAGIADAFLTHDRTIHTRADDSVVRTTPAGPVPVRRARGHAPEPLPLPVPARRPVLACGAELKSTFCLATGHRAVVSPHLGDLEHPETLRSFTEGIAHLRRLTGTDPELIAHDLHPEYLSTKYAHDLADSTGAHLMGVQHHHAHIASCLADNAEHGPVIGVAFDGLGYGTDGTLWGGEFLLADLTDFHRAAHFTPVPLPGGPAAIREPWRMAAAYLDACGEDPDDLPVYRRNRARWDQVRALARGGTHAPPTSSVGRLFDAVAALLDLRDTVSYEGQAAVDLEQCADPSITDAYEAQVTADGRIHGTDLIREVLTDVRAGTPPETVAARFHNALARTTAAVCHTLRETTHLTRVALSGGVFQNAYLLDRTTAALRRHDFHVLTHRRIPPNDAGISLGQAAVTAARTPA